MHRSAFSHPSLVFLLPRCPLPSPRRRPAPAHRRPHSVDRRASIILSGLLIRTRYELIAHRRAAMRSKSFTHGRSRSLSDPLAKALLPPPDETAEDRERRLRNEQEAQKVSDAIDEQIKLDRQAYKKQKQAIKVLLLGQSESGKSTTLKRESHFLHWLAWRPTRTSARGHRRSRLLTLSHVPQNFSC